MHSTIIAINSIITEDELLERMPNGTDYVTEKEDPDWYEWAARWLSKIGAVGMPQNHYILKLDRKLIEEELVRLYEHYQERAIDSFAEFADGYKSWLAADAILPEFGLYIYSHETGLIPWVEFLRTEYGKYPSFKADEPLAVTGVFDYHF